MIELEKLANIYAYLKLVNATEETFSFIIKQIEKTVSLDDETYVRINKNKHTIAWAPDDLMIDDCTIPPSGILVDIVKDIIAEFPNITFYCKHVFDDEDSGYIYVTKIKCENGILDKIKVEELHFQQKNLYNSKKWIFEEIDVIYANDFL